MEKMADHNELEILGKGVDAWNQWRRDNPSVTPVLRDADLSDMDLPGANLAEADLDGAELFDSNFDTTNLKMATMRGADLSGASLSGAELYKVDLRGASLIGADLSGAYLAEADLSGADLRGARLMNADLAGADLSGANCSGADLSSASLVRARVNRADFRNANLAHADLSTMHYGSFRLMKGRFYGVRGLDSCFGNALFVRDAKDQDYLDTLELAIEATDPKILRRWKKLWFRAWGFIDYGRSLSRIFLYASIMAMAFGMVYFCDQRFGWGLLKYSSAATSPLSPFYHSVVTYTKLGFGYMTPKHWLGEILLVSEGILGYVTLGLLLSILANRVARRS